MTTCVHGWHLQSHPQWYSIDGRVRLLHIGGRWDVSAHEPGDASALSAVGLSGAHAKVGVHDLLGGCHAAIGSQHQMQRRGSVYYLVGTPLQVVKTVGQWRIDYADMTTDMNADAPRANRYCVAARSLAYTRYLTRAAALKALATCVDPPN